METLQTSTFPYGPVDLVGGLASDGTEWVKAIVVQSVMGKADNSYRYFLNGKSPEALMCKALASGEKFFKVPGYNKPVRFLPVEAVAIYWSYLARKGNKKAQAVNLSIVAADLKRTIRETNGVKRIV